MIIIGCGETGERVYNFVHRHHLFNVIAFAANKQFCHGQTFKDLPIWPVEELRQYADMDATYVFVAVFWNRLNADRRRLFEEVKKLNYRFASLVSPLAIVNGMYGVNCWINDYVIMQDGSIIGDNCYLMEQSVIGHLAQIGDHCFFALKAVTLGSTRIGEQCFIGTGATIFDTTHIGNKCLIGACTAIKRHVPDFTVCKLGNDNVVTKNYSEDIIESKWLAKGNVR